MSTSSAKLLFDSSEVTSKTIVEKIQAVGFEVKILSESKYKGNEEAEGIGKESIMKTVLLSLREPTGRTFTSSEIRSMLETLEAALLQSTDVENGNLQALGVDSVELILGDAQVKVAFDDTLVGPRDFVALAKSLLLDVSVSSFGGFMMASRLLARQERESKEFLRLVQLALLLTVPVVFVSMIFPMMGKFDFVLSASFRPGVTYSSIFLLIFTFPVEFVVGYRFHKKAYQSFKTGSLGMDFMISTGTLAAYFYSVIGMVRSGESGDSSMMMTSNYFDTSAVLITAVLLGKYLELYARGQTASAIHKLTGLKAKTARLVGCLPQGLYESMEKDSSALLNCVSFGSSASNGYLPLNGIAEQIIDASLLHKFDVIRLVAGESIPADGELLEGGHLGVDESMMTVSFFVVSPFLSYWLCSLG
jgi:Cu+-exporting ATPase